MHAVRPAFEGNLTVVSPNSTILDVSFRIHHHLHNFLEEGAYPKPGIKHRLRYKSHFQNDPWKTVISTDLEKREERRKIRCDHLYSFSLASCRFDSMILLLLPILVTTKISVFNKHTVKVVIDGFLGTPRLARHLTVSFFLCSSKSNSLGKVEGP